MKLRDNYIHKGIGALKLKRKMPGHGARRGSHLAAALVVKVRRFWRQKGKMPNNTKAFNNIFRASCIADAPAPASQATALGRRDVRELHRFWRDVLVEPRHRDVGGRQQVHVNVVRDQGLRRRAQLGRKDGGHGDANAARDLRGLKRGVSREEAETA